VQQVLMTINIALLRQIWQLDYYSEGSVPDAPNFMGARPTSSNSRITRTPSSLGAWRSCQTGSFPLEGLTFVHDMF
jgi:hypothetical protein